ncbi:hypothetical protein CAEBREN_13620 [Caenorhabditis brenneri]|uniref:Uncharacterized protein n=1 Tax=Caenorhabditis brenneri TaxID=135651 RepID=G0NM16_CAEBE|nr:hypothetical protein CAEBREN_13620 [Caenorhabditis brenneri]
MEKQPIQEPIPCTFLLPPTSQYNGKLKRATKISLIGDIFVLSYFLGLFYLNTGNTPVVLIGISILAKMFLIVYTPVVHGASKDPMYSLRCALLLCKMSFIRFLMMAYDYTLFINGVINLGDSQSFLFKYGVGFMGFEMFYTVIFSIYLAFLIPDVLKVERCDLDEEQLETPLIVVESGLQ